VLVSPDGVLGRLPPAALPGREPGTYLLEDWPLAVIPAAQALPGLLQYQGRKRPAGNLLVLGDVDYDARSAAPAAKPKKEFLAHVNRAPRQAGSAPFPRLDGTHGELATIEKMYRETFGETGVQTLAGARATKQTLLREAPRHLYLHLATHGFFAAANFQSALERSGQAEQLGDVEFVSQQTLAGYHPQGCWDPRGRSESLKSELVRRVPT
jgi:CHAT domain-containing protein